MSLTPELVEDYIDWLLEAQGILRPKVEAYDEIGRRLFFDDLRAYEKRRDALKHEIHKGKLKIEI